MIVYSRKGQRRIELDLDRVRKGEPKANLERNAKGNCRYEAAGKAFRNKGRNRFKTGKKRQKPGKKSL